MGAGLAWLYSLADQERGVGWNPRASPDEQWKLGRTRALLDLAGGPDRRMRIVLVAGTKGKGSTCALLASILGAAGLRCGLYTKPHLQTYRERIRVDGTAVSSEDFERSVEHMRSLVPGVPEAAGEPTTFEVTTALALDHFARLGCEIAVLEVGLGGRLDATNATEPELSVITPISYDHTAILGRTLREIASEKAGILRNGRPALLAEQRPAAMRAIHAACRRVGAVCHVVPALASDGVLAEELPLRGAHQWQNAAMAVAAARVLVPAITDAAVADGVRRLRWAGRFEVIQGEPTIVLDGAHNGASAEALARTLFAFADGAPISLVLAINRDKDARAVLRPLVPLARTIWVTRTCGNPRALEPRELARLCRRLGARHVEVEPEVGRALDCAKRYLEQTDVVCVTGSLMLVGQARAALGMPSPERLW